jgi:acyl-CoA reductase-like NAD-dependent aldehyde dehydrogenase
VAPRPVLRGGDGNGVLIVAADADLDAAAATAVRGGCQASGQQRDAVQRVLVEASVRTDFLAALLPRMAALTVGDPRDERTDVAPLVDPRATERVRGWLADAIETGADPLFGGGIDGRAVQPTVLADVRDGLHAWDEAALAPLVCVRAVGSMAEAVASVNASRHAPAVSLFGGDWRDLASVRASVVTVGGLPGPSPLPADAFTVTTPVITRGASGNPGQM